MPDHPAKLSAKFLQHFIETASAELGEKNLPVVLEKAGLPSEWAKSEIAANLDEQAAAEAYAGIQQSLRTYYGRGARGILQRIGSRLWEDLLENAPLKEKAQSKLMRRLPETVRRKSALEMLSRLLGAKSSEITVHTLDMNLLLVDKISAATFNQHATEPICHVTHGLIREAVYWATAHDPVIEETECKANGGSACEFRITFGDEE